MPDREKVIKGLECCMKWTGEPNTATCHCSDCSYTNMDILGQRCLIDLINDALALLKEQEHKDRMFHALEDDWKRLNELLKEQDKVKPEYEGDSRSCWWYACGDCHGAIDSKDRFCRHCGREIDWNEQGERDKEEPAGGDR